ncbi:MAG: hypothetical protein EOO41_00190, partial [Methanobacteriota archaeon]
MRVSCMRARVHTFFTSAPHQHLARAQDLALYLGERPAILPSLYGVDVGTASGLVTSSVTSVGMMSPGKQKAGASDAAGISPRAASAPLLTQSTGCWVAPHDVSSLLCIGYCPPADGEPAGGASEGTSGSAGGKSAAGAITSRAPAKAAAGNDTGKGKGSAAGGPGTEANGAVLFVSPFDTIVNVPARAPYVQSMSDAHSVWPARAPLPEPRFVSMIMIGADAAASSAAGAAAAAASAHATSTAAAGSKPAVSSKATPTMPTAMAASAKLGAKVSSEASLRDAAATAHAARAVQVTAVFPAAIKQLHAGAMSRSPSFHATSPTSLAAGSELGRPVTMDTGAATQPHQAATSSLSTGTDGVTVWRCRLSGLRLLQALVLGATHDVVAAQCHLMAARCLVDAIASLSSVAGLAAGVTGDRPPGRNGGDAAQHATGVGLLFSAWAEHAPEAERHAAVRILREVLVRACVILSVLLPRFERAAEELGAVGPLLSDSVLCAALPGSLLCALLPSVRVPPTWREADTEDELSALTAVALCNPATLLPYSAAQPEADIAETCFELLRRMALCDALYRVYDWTVPCSPSPVLESMGEAGTSNIGLSAPNNASGAGAGNAKAPPSAGGGKGAGAGLASPAPAGGAVAKGGGDAKKGGIASATKHRDSIASQTSPAQFVSTLK